MTLGRPEELPIKKIRPEIAVKRIVPDSRLKTIKARYVVDFSEKKPIVFVAETFPKEICNLGIQQLYLEDNIRNLSNAGWFLAA